MICYLLGTRPCEALTLRRGCVDHDPVAGLWLRGTQWEGATDETGAKLPRASSAKTRGWWSSRSFAPWGCRSACRST